MLLSSDLPDGILFAEAYIEAMASTSGGTHAWPSPLSKDAYHGVVGEFVRAIAPHTEGDPAAVLIQTLACMGNAMGRLPHFMVEDTRHGTNINVALVGATSGARKGTSLDRAYRFTALADPGWDAINNGEGGLSSPEGLVHAVRDPSGSGGPKSDPGVVDKRLLAAMGEFGETLSKMKREANPLGAMIRSAWDGKTLRIRTRTKPLIATGAHVSVIGHITEVELDALLGQTDIFNGFGNRFLWAVAKRANTLPHGGSLRVDDLTEQIKQADKALRFAWKEDRRIDFDRAAAKIWPDLYAELGRSADGKLGAITDRAEPQVRRLALIYAVLDLSPRVKPVHLRAAVEVWRYCEDSAAYLFSDAPTTPLEVRVERLLLKVDGWISKSMISRRLKSPTSYQLDAALAALASRDRVEVQRVKTAGRPREDYRIKR